MNTNTDPVSQIYQACPLSVPCSFARRTSRENNKMKRKQWSAQAELYKLVLTQCYTQHKDSIYGGPQEPRA